MSKRGRGSGREVAAALEAQFGRPEPTDWRKHYEPEALDEYAGELAELEAQLDQHWPGWRKREPFDKLKASKQAWIKARLKRHEQIVTGRGDWGVNVVEVGGKVYAASVKPGGDIALKSYRPLVSVPMLVEATGRSREFVEDALANLPRHVRDVRTHLGRGGSGHAHLPSGSATAPASLPGGEA